MVAGTSGIFLGLEDLLEPWLVKGEEESRFGQRQRLL